MITKLQASEAFGYGYRIEYRGSQRRILSVNEGYINVVASNVLDSIIYFEDFGTEAKILCRPFSHLTKEIDGKILIVELAKKYPPESRYIITHHDSVREFDGKIFQVNCCVDNDSERYIYFTIESDITKNRYALNQELKSMHFSFFDDSVVKWME